MSEFISWDMLCTYEGALVMVMILTQFTKDLFFTKRIPTQIWSYILAFTVLILSHAFLDGLTLNVAAQTLFNAVIVSIAANGGYEVLHKSVDKLSFRK